MTSQFRSRIRASLADNHLQSALDANAERRIQVRQQAFASLPDPQILRQKAHRVRADVIAHLDEYLDEFVRRATKNGMQVHRAANAQGVIEMVMEIVRQKQARLIAKSKTMVSEEIKFNHALESQGLKVVETDLGEFIVQLRGETPSHIITPAVHLRREDVGKLFEDKLGLAYTEDIGLMTDAARSVLRQVFLEADIGISGVNFGVAESGTVCVVTNEGNGRMVTTLPHTHIALMGIERLVPTLDDLALMLSLLPRSATGQKLSVYTSLLNGPRRANDPDGPDERHIILVDNGRNAVRASELQEILYCIRCGACLNACPVFREIGGHAYIGVDGEGSPYPGPIGSVISPALFEANQFGHLARASSLCGACREACPVDIDLPRLLLRVRAGMGTNRVKPWIKSNAPWWLSLGIHLYTFAATSGSRFTIAQRLAGWLGRMAVLFSGDDRWIRLPSFSGWGLSRDFPRPANIPFHSRPGHKVIRQNVGEPSEVNLGQPAASAERKEAPTISVEALQTRLAAELEALGAKYHACSPSESSLFVLNILREKEIHEILAWDPAFLPEGMLETIAREGIRVFHPDGESLENDSQIRAGITGAAAIAETGSLLVLGGAGRPLGVSLLPAIHIAVIRSKDILETVSEALQVEGIRQASASVIITGPSRTADIEMTLTIGVHGPGELHVICVQED